MRRRQVGVEDAQVDPQLRAVPGRIETGLQDGQQAGLHRQIKVGFGYKCAIARVEDSIAVKQAKIDVADEEGSQLGRAAIHRLPCEWVKEHWKPDISAAVQAAQVNRNLGHGEGYLQAVVVQVGAAHIGIDLPGAVPQTLHTPVSCRLNAERKDKYRRKGKGRRCSLEDTIYSIPCRTTVVF